MLKSTLTAAISLLMAARVAHAVCGIHSFTTCEDQIVHWYDPLTGEICDPLDCGGGRAPVKYDQPGCAAYTGTKTLATSASYLSCWKPPGATTTIGAMTEVQPTQQRVDTTASVESSSEAKASVQTTQTSQTSASPATTSTAAPSTVTSSTQSSSAPQTTSAPATLTTTVKPTESDKSSTRNSTLPSTTTSKPKPSDNAATIVQGSLVAMAGIAVGVVFLA